ncbi:hypothetical protein EDD80_10114 [Anseongella ginsenosidimutans]|uniref:GT2 family glycosyltransferase n=1 Tax=Anseongella ginsenosidimutans TaxID=496056 RepID=A0A4R3KVS3_9SPHI|nr:hypothetical protein [Anseongella ginsenosidimutans]TCS89817.1 hypothetical protein EDD80_10114 [Anseongella ginsenosidimutans]
MRKKICCVLLEYCGGWRTDLLYRKFKKWNPGYDINVLDNASHESRSTVITHQNEENSGVGGGIIDSLKIARDQGAQYLFLVVNDIVPITRIEMKYFEIILDNHPEIVQLSASITKNSDQGGHYPWMVSNREHKNRAVLHSDILCCALDIDFIESFGGFPMSKSGWGYDWEIAYQAKLLQRKIVISDFFKVKHVNYLTKNNEEIRQEKRRELRRVYNERYGSYKVMFDL